MHQTLRHLLLLAVVAGVAFFTNLGGARLWDRDEPRNAGCAAEMLERGDWVVPVFNAELRTHKPVLLYWFMMASYATFGQSEFAARFPSAMLGVGSVLVTYLIGRRLFGARAGMWSALMLATCVMFALVHRAATPDGSLIFFATLSMLVYVLGAFPKPSEGENEVGSDELTPPPGVAAAATTAVDASSDSFFPRRWWIVALMYAVMAVATLAKGPVGMALPTFVIGMFLLIVRLPAPPPLPDHLRGGRRWLEIARRALRPFAPLHFARTAWSMRPLTALLMLALIAVPWYVLVGVRTDGAWLRGFFLEHNLGRASQPMEGHGGGFWFYPVAVAIGFFPWTILLGAVAVSVVRWSRRRDEPARPGFLFLACWACVYVGIFTLARTKLPSYVTPMYPALALLAGGYVDRWTRRLPLPDELRPRLTFWTLSAIGACLALGIAVAAHLMLGGARWLAVGGLIPVVGGIACAALAERQRRTHAAFCMVATAGLLVLAMYAIGAPTIDRYQKSDVLLQAIRSNSPAPRVGSFGRLEPSWVYYLDRPIYEIPKRELDEAERFVESGRDTFLITTADRYEELRPKLPADVERLASVPYFAREGTLVVLGRRRANGGGAAAMVNP